jgi:protein-L-isoaspartate(D-aspartate) O-methyltransferase
VNRNWTVARRRMVREQLAQAGIDDPTVLKVMGEVPRHRFVPGPLEHRAYQPSALPIGFGQTISKPFTVALMTALLELRGDERILEIGTGSGYQAAVLSHLTAAVFTVERIVPLAERARRLLAELGRDNVTVIAADGQDGAAVHAPFDAILVTASAPRVPPALAAQVRDGGYVLLPVAKNSKQTLYRFRRHGVEMTVEESIPCGFVPLRTGLSEGAARA